MWTDTLFSFISDAFSVANTSKLRFFKKSFKPSHDDFIMLLHAVLVSQAVYLEWIYEKKNSKMKWIGMNIEFYALFFFQSSTLTCVDINGKLDSSLRTSEMWEAHAVSLRIQPTKICVPISIFIKNSKSTIQFSYQNIYWITCINIVW